MGVLLISLQVARVHLAQEKARSSERWGWSVIARQEKGAGPAERVLPAPQGPAGPAWFPGSMEETQLPAVAFGCLVFSGRQASGIALFISEQS